MSFCLILLAAGGSKRFNSKIPKPFVKVGGKTLLEHSLFKFSKIKHIKKIIVVANKKHNKFFNEKRIKKDLMQNKKLKKINILGADIYVVKARDFFTTGINGMKKKVNYFVN